GGEADAKARAHRRPARPAAGAGRAVALERGGAAGLPRRRRRRGHDPRADEPPAAAGGGGAQKAPLEGKLGPRAPIAGVLAVSALTLVGGGDAAPTAQAV